MTSWLTYVIFAVMILSVIYGWKRGLIRTLMAMVSWILVLLLAVWLNPYISVFLKQNTGLKEEVAARCTAFLASVLIAMLLVKWIGTALNLLAHLPVLGFLNHLGGAGIGILRGILWMWLFFLLITIFAQTEWGAVCMEEVEKDPLLQSLYANNYLMKALLNTIK